jgi:hypothetical protein
MTEHDVAQVTDLAMAALWYAKNGIPVFPCKPRGKEPLTPHGFKDATTDEKKVAEWWSKWPGANIGVPTGAASGLLVVDVDPRNGGPQGRDELIRQLGPIPDTAEIITGGGGRHLYFKYGGGGVPKALAPGIDLKGDGGYIIAPPSIHPSGKRYEVDGLAGAKAFLNIAEAPTWLLERIAMVPNAGRAETEAEPTKWKTGERNTTLTSLAGTMRRRGLSREATEAALLEENRRRCDPPLPDEEVREIAASVARYEPAKENTPRTRERVETADAGSLSTRRISDIQAKPICWLWPGRIARGKLTIIAGNPGLGKSQITASIAAIVTTGGLWPVDRARCAAGDVIFLTAEDDPADTLRPRLEAAGADVRRVHVVDGVIVGYRGDGAREDRTFCIGSDLRALETKLAELDGAAAVVIDPISAYLGKTDSHNNSEVRGVLAPLSELAARHNTAVVGVSHLTKAAGAQALMRVTGSLAFVAAARAAYLVTVDPNDKARRLFLPMKNNLWPDTSGLAFRIEGATVQSSAGPLPTSLVAWEPEPVSVTADEIIAQAANPEEASALNEAADWLWDLLDGGPLLAKDVATQAKGAGIAKSTLRRAADKLQIDRAKAGYQGAWMWSLPPKVLKMSKDAQEKNLSTFGQDEHLWTGAEAEIEL